MSDEETPAAPGSPQAEAPETTPAQPAPEPEPAAEPQPEPNAPASPDADPAAAAAPPDAAAAGDFGPPPPPPPPDASASGPPTVHYREQSYIQRGVIKELRRDLRFVLEQQARLLEVALAQGELIQTQLDSLEIYRTN